MNGVSDPVVCDSVLREVIRPDLFRSSFSADLLQENTVHMGGFNCSTQVQIKIYHEFLCVYLEFSSLVSLTGLLLQSCAVEFCPQKRHGLLLVLYLRSLLLAFGDYT